MRAKLEAAVASVYFYLNSAGLPQGWLFTQALTPLYAWWLLLNRWRWLAVTALVLAPFVLMHLRAGVDDTQQYLISLGLLLTSVIFGLRVAAWAADGEALTRVIRFVGVTCFGLTLVALVLLYTPLDLVFWSYDNISANIYQVPRLVMLTYEASYFSSLLVPVWAWAFLRWLYLPTRPRLGWLAMATLPLVLSFSLGLLTLMGGAAALVVLLRWRWVLRHAQPVFGSLFVALALFLLLGTENPLSERLQNIRSGGDSSSNSRTLISLRLGVQLAEMRSPYWGAGLGQHKIIAPNLIREPQAQPKYWVPRLPNAIAETIASLGWVGLAVRLGLQLWLFFGARVWQNSFQLCLFLVPFLYQFVGSYLVNVPEFVMWALAANRSFPELDFPWARRASASGPTFAPAAPQPLLS